MSPRPRQLASDSIRASWVRRARNGPTVAAPIYDLKLIRDPCTNGAPAKLIVAPGFSQPPTFSSVKFIHVVASGLQDPAEVVRCLAGHRTPNSRAENLKNTGGLA